MFVIVRDALIAQIMPIVFTVLVTVLIPYLAVLVGKYINARIEGERSLLIRWAALQAVKYAEQVLPDRGRGSARFDLAAAYLIARFPFLAAQTEQVKALIEEAVWDMDAELKKILQTVNPTPGQ